MDKINIADDLKTTVEELLLGDKKITRCGSKGEGLLANHLLYKVVTPDNKVELFEIGDYIRRIVREELGLENAKNNITLVNSEAVPIQYN